MDGKAAVLGGLALAAAVATWQVVSAAALPGSPAFVPVAVILQFVVMGVLLRATAARQGYRAQVLTGVVAGTIATVLIGASSLLVSTVLFPGLGAEIGVTPVEGALAGAIGTFTTAIVVSVGLSLVFKRED